MTSTGTDPDTSPHEDAQTIGPSRTARYTTYVLIGSTILAVLVVALLLHQSGEAARDADAKADELIAQLEEDGLRAPDQDVIVQVLGNDGGAACENPDNALTRAALAAQLVNGAGGPGARPVIADSRVLEGQAAIMSVYCPEELEDFQAYRDRLETAEVAS